MALLIDVYIALTARMMEVLFWTIYIPNSTNLMFFHPSTADVPGRFHVVEQIQQEMSTAV
jgi:hypothetical protein